MVSTVMYSLASVSSATPDRAGASTLTCSSALSSARCSASSDPNDDALTYSWDFGDGNTSTAQNPVYNYAAFGTYTVQLIVTNSNGCIDSISLPVIVPEMPIADFTFDTACAGLPTQFTDLSIGNSSPLATWAWDFDDGNTSSVQDPIHTYATFGTYNVQLIVVNDNNCIDSINSVACVLLCGWLMMLVVVVVAVVVYAQGGEGLRGCSRK